jgi:cyclohexadieny/prephenate dehydrogenase
VFRVGSFQACLRGPCQLALTWAGHPGIASGRDICLNNREALLEMLARCMEDAQAMSRAVRWSDAAYIEDTVERGRKIRRSLIELEQA